MLLFHHQLLPMLPNLRIIAKDTHISTTKQQQQQHLGEEQSIQNSSEVF